MKKLLSILAVIFTVFLVASCNSESNENVDPTTITINVNRENLGDVVVQDAFYEDAHGGLIDFNNEGLGFVYSTLEYVGTKNYSNVRFVVTVDQENALQIVGEDTEGNWLNVITTGWGPVEGFDINIAAQAVSKFYIVGLQEGQFTVTLKLVDVANDNAVIVSNYQSITVISVA